MVKQLGSTGKVDGNSANFGLAPAAGRENAISARLGRRWQAFLAGPRLASGPALLIIVLVSLLAWAAVIGLFYYLAH